MWNTRHSDRQDATYRSSASATWRFSQEEQQYHGRDCPNEVIKLLDTFAGCGGNFIDTANSYGGGKAEICSGSSSPIVTAKIT